MGDQAVPAGRYRSAPRRGFDHAPSAACASRALFRRVTGPAVRPDRRGQGHPGPAPVHPRPPLPARRGHGLGRRPGRFLRPVTSGRRAPRRRLRRLLRRPLHGRVGRHPHRGPPAGPAPRPERRMLDGRHGRPRRRGGGLGDAGRGDRRGEDRARHLHELLGRPEGLRGPPRGGRLHVVERRRRPLLGPLTAGRGRGARRQGPLLPRPAPGPQHRFPAGLRRR